MKAFLERAEIDALLTIVDSATTWERGRQGTGYEKLSLPVGRDFGPTIAALTDKSVRALVQSIGGPMLGHDRYLIRYTDGTGVPPHRDPPLANNLRHLRLNAIISAPTTGGELRMDGAIRPLVAGDAVIFRPDLVLHEVTPVVGRRLVWSVGCNY
jgi:hypothetical protein